MKRFVDLLILVLEISLSVTGCHTSKGDAPPPPAHSITIAFMPMLRVPFFASNSLPNGRIQLYGGFALSFVMSGQINVHFSELPQPVVADVKKGTGAGFFAGVPLNLSRVALFGELRSMNMSIDFSNEDENLFGAEMSADLSVDTRQTVFGVRFLY
jgi:hypothetical protein